MIGGGVMKQERLFGLVRTRMRHWLGGYITHAQIDEETFVSAPGLGSQAGVKGALALAAMSVEENA